MVGKKNLKPLANSVYAVGQKIDQLTILEKLPSHYCDKWRQWRCLCDCGREVVKSTAHFSGRARLNCGDRVHVPGGWYPPNPVELSSEVWQTIKEFLPLVEGSHYKAIDQEAQDARMERLIRAAWILYYKEHTLKIEITDLYRSRYIRKHLSYSRYYQPTDSDKPYTRENKTGSEVTDLTFPLYPVQALGNDIMTIPSGKRFRFKRC